MLDDALQELPSSTPRLFAVNGVGTADGPAPAVQYRIVFDSSLGGSLSVVVEGDGSIVGVDAEYPPPFCAGYGPAESSGCSDELVESFGGSFPFEGRVGGR